MGNYYVVDISAPWSIVLRRPGLFAIGVHGPGAEPEAFIYPWPAHLTGILASIVFEAGNDCAQSSEVGEEFSDTHACLQRLFGNNYKIYSGFARKLNGDGEPAETLVSISYRALYDLDKVWKGLKDASSLFGREGRISAGEITSVFSSVCPKENAVRPAIYRRTGIAVKRIDKTVIERMLYTHAETFLFSSKDMKPLQIELLLNTTRSVREGRYLVKLGADNRPGILVIRKDAAQGQLAKYELKARGEPCKALLLSISPALLDHIPRSLDNTLVINEDRARQLASKLLEESGLDKFAKPIAPWLVQLNRDSAKVVSVGWSMARGYLRKPMLVLPPGLILPLQITECNITRLKDIVTRGIGKHSRLGWGTFIAYFFED